MRPKDGRSKDSVSSIVLAEAIPTVFRANRFIVVIQFVLVFLATATLVSQQQRRRGYPQEEGEGLNAHPDECESFPITCEWVAAMMTVEAVDCHGKCEH